MAARKIEGKPIPGLSLINEVNSQNFETKSSSEKFCKARAERAEDTQKTRFSKLVPDKCVHIGSDIEPSEKEKLVQFIATNADIFGWPAKDLQGLAETYRNILQMSTPKPNRISKN